MPSPKSSEIIFRHRRYLQQAGWTKGLRLHLYRKTGLARCRRVLDLGCGTGVLAQEISERAGGAVFGLDRDQAALGFAAREHGSGIRWALGEAGSLPYGDGSFDLVVTQYFWMWAGRPERVVSECHRVLASGGWLAALAEPEYGRRTDLPPELSVINCELAARLAREGADPDMGTKVEELFRKAGLRTEAGVVEQGWGPKEHRREFRHEWAYVENVLKGQKCLRGLKSLESKAIEKKERRSVMPVHWAVGRKAL